ncbi:Glycosyltransferase [Quillaja saponaria]|uniref:Glycosyltransferase n=1 Tax=Quillaja saponaria TaxID=32244 RepID=A0AAD7M203_QUISA|nr:Glycosyltransferase [Quillaja saponaria]
MTFSIKAAQELEIPFVVFRTISACGSLCNAHLHSLLDKGIIPLKDESYLRNGYLDTVVNWIPGLKNFRLWDFPSSIRKTDPNDLMLNFFLGENDTAYKASAIILNTFDELEPDALNALSSMFPPIYTIGPLNLLVNQIPQNNLTNSLTFAWGLANSKKPFLWVIRPYLVDGGSEILSSEFVNEIKDRGLIVSWCPQEQVLSHPSIGGFLTHCGWNSMLESFSAGVPIICWPFFSDQPTNCRFACTELGIGMEIDTNVKRDSVEKMVNELIEGKKGKEMLQKVMEWKKKAEDATCPHGSSYMNLDKLVKEVLLK